MKLQVALDWTPNTNHSGFYIALEKGWYSEANIEVRQHFVVRFCIFIF